MSLLRGISGVIAGGVVILATIIVAAALWGRMRGFPGPGAESVIWHVGAAVIVIVAQAFTDRRTGPAALTGTFVVVAAAGVLLWTQWWS